MGTVTIKGTVIESLNQGEDLYVQLSNGQRAHFKRNMVTFDETEGETEAEEFTGTEVHEPEA